MTTGASFARGASKQDYETPRDLLIAIEERFRVSFTWDLASNGSNAKAPHYLTEREDALSADWTKLGGGEPWAQGPCWLNPPFGNIAPWAAKCAASVVAKPSMRIYFLVPAAVGSNWYARHVHPYAMVYALNGRVCFDGKAPFPKDIILAIYGEPPEFDVWRWK